MKLLLVTALVAALSTASMLRESPPLVAPLMAYERKKSATDINRLHSNFGGGVPAVASLLVHTTLIQKLTHGAVPLLEHIALTTPIPAQDAAHYSFPSFELSNFTLGSVAVVFQAPDVIQATFSNVSVVVPTVPFYVYEKIFSHKIGCHGTFSATVSNSLLTVTLQLERSPLNGTLLIASSTATAVFGALNIQHSFDSDICSIAGTVIGFFFGGLTELLKELVQEDLPPKIAHIVQNKTNEVLGESPLRLAASPNITTTGLVLVAELLPSNATPPTVPSPTFDQFTARDLEAYVTEASLNTVLAIKAAEGDFSGKFALPPTINTSSIRKFLPAAYALCEDCALAVDLSPQVPPYTVVAPGGVQFSFVQLQAAVTAANATTLSPVPLMTLSLDLSLALSNISVVGAKQDTIYFQVQLPALSATVVSSSIGTLDIPLLVELLNFVISDILLKDFNSHFAGITLPNIDGFSADNVVLDFTVGQIALAFDIDVPPHF